MKFHAVIILLFLSAISGCSGNISGNTVKEEGIYEEGISIETYFCPRDSCENIIINNINNAKNSAHCAFFVRVSRELYDASCASLQSLAQSQDSRNATTSTSPARMKAIQASGRPSGSGWSTRSTPDGFARPSR